MKALKSLRMTIEKTYSGQELRQIWEHGKTENEECSHQEILRELWVLLRRTKIKFVMICL